MSTDTIKHNPETLKRSQMLITIVLQGRNFIFNVIPLIFFFVLLLQFIEIKGIPGEQSDNLMRIDLNCDFI